MFQLALIQMNVVGGQKEVNLRHAADLIAQVADQGADVILLPEAMNLGWTHSTSRQEADSIPDGRTCTLLRAAARQHRCYVCSGLAEQDGLRVFNSAVLIDPDGEVILRHRKLNE